MPVLSNYALYPPEGYDPSATKQLDPAPVPARAAWAGIPLWALHAFYAVSSVPVALRAVVVFPEFEAVVSPAGFGISWLAASALVTRRRTGLFAAAATIITFLVAYDLVTSSFPFRFAPLVVIAMLLSRRRSPGHHRHRRGQRPTAPSSQPEPCPVQTAHVRVWGEAGAHVGAHTAFGDTAKIGAAGERRVGAALDSLTQEYPFVRVFHGLRFTPGVNGADLDHLVIIGDHVIQVDAKNWAYGNYTWTNQETIWRGGAPFTGGQVNAVSCRNKWSAFLSRLPRQHPSPVLSRVVLAQPRSGRYGIDNSGAPNAVAMYTLDDLLSELRHYAANTDPVVNRYLVHACLLEVQSSRIRR